MSAMTSRVFTCLALMLLGCTPPPPLTNASGSEPQLQACSAPRPMICTMNYAPVCGLRGEIWQTFSNACSACSNKEVSDYHSGECVAEK